MAPQKTLSFTKMHGLGNSYIYIDLFRENVNGIDLATFARQVADVHRGIGSDGLILIGPSEQMDLQMRIFNKDGSEAKNCGNGLRCVARYAVDHKIVSHDPFSIETRGGPVYASVNRQSGEVTIDMGEPKLRRADIPAAGGANKMWIDEPVAVDGEKKSMTAVSMGNPHGVFFVEDIRSAPLERFGRVLADHHSLFPEGLNVEFVEMISNDKMRLRVWERGSGITEACGTGACAAVVAAVLNDKTKKGTEVLVHLDGGDLKICWKNDGRVLMTGGAETICHGVVQVCDAALK